MTSVGVASEELSEDEEDDENLVFVTSWLSDGTVHKIQGELAVGRTYVLKETIAPVGYGFIKADIYFMINEDGTISTEAPYAEDENGNTVLLVEDEAINLVVNKVDYHSKEILVGATFAIYDSETEEEIISWTTDEEGYYDLGAQLLADKAYVLKEIEAPEGYMTIEDVEFVVDREGNIELITESKYVTCLDGYMEVGNERIPVETGDSSNVGMYFMLMLLSMLGIAIPRSKKQ